MSVPATYDEPKGISVLEAMANGVPVVLPRRGSFPEMIGKTGGGLLVAPDDPEALAGGLLEVWRNPDLAVRLTKACAATTPRRSWRGGRWRSSRCARLTDGRTLHRLKYQSQKYCSPAPWR
jgi:glycosyltransferase involved in cell wall biosynthesis